MVIVFLSFLLWELDAVSTFRSEEVNKKSLESLIKEASKTLVARPRIELGTS